MPNEDSTAKNKLQQLLKRRHQFENCSYAKSSLTTQFNKASDSSLNWNQLSISSKSYALNTSENYKKAFLCHSQVRQFTTKHQDVPTVRRQKSKQKLLNATKSVDNLLNYPHKMKNKWFYPDFQEASKYKKRLSIKQFEQNTHLMNSTSPLEQWKKVEKKYRRLQTQQSKHNLTCDHSQTQGSRRPSSKFLEHVINIEQKNIEIGKESFELKLLLKRFNKGRVSSPANKKETEIERKIVLKKSKGPEVSNQRRTQKGQEKKCMKKDKFAFVTQEQQHEPDRGNKLFKETEKKNSGKSQKQNEEPVILIHKQPLERYIQSFFSPLYQSVKKTSMADKSNIEVAKRALIRIKTKKFTMRSIERLQKLSRNLFKDKSQRDLYRTDQQASNQMDREGHKLKGHNKFEGKGKNESKENAQGTKKPDKSKDIDCEIVPDPSKGKGQSLAVRFPAHLKSRNQHQSFPSNFIRQAHLQAQSCGNSSGKLGQVEQRMNKQMNFEGTKTPPLRKISISSSEVLFDESLTPNKEVQRNNQQGFFNAW